MSKNTRRTLSEPSAEELDLTELFEKLNLQKESDSQKINMDAQITALQNQMAALIANYQVVNTTNAELVQELNQLKTTQATLQAQQATTSNVAVVEYTDVVPEYLTGDSIQLDAFKVIHEFNGDKKVYRSWRTQVEKLMQQIEDFKTHPKYAAALAIIRAKITGPASDILINNNTALNIDAIIDRLDFSYADQRPLYVIEAEMTNIGQGNKTLQEFYDAINQALNMVLTKITMSYKEKAAQQSLIAESQNKAIRTFITGLNSSLMRTTLYSNAPKSLSQAMAIAQTIQYDNQHLQLDHHYKTSEQQRFMKKPVNDMKPKFNPNFRYQPQQSTQAPKFNNFVPYKQPQQQQLPKPIPMDVDSSRRNIQPTQFQRNNFQAMKRDRDPSFQQPNNQQRVNHVDEIDGIQSVHGDSMDNNCGTEIDDCQSTTSEQQSTFLEE